MLVGGFGDLHGKFAQATLQARLWEEKNDETIDALLQVGDTGFYRNLDEADKATREHIQKGKAGVSYLPYLRGDLTSPYRVYFTRGNHEDFDLLNEHQDASIDPGGRLRHLRDGTVHLMGTGDDSVLVAGLGGIEPPNVKQSKWEVHVGERYVDPNAVEILLGKEPGSVDVLITHDAPWGHGLKDNPETGSKMVKEVVEHLQPRFHFYGHYSNPPAPFDLGATRCVGLRQELDSIGEVGAPAVIDSNDWSIRSFPRTGGRA